MKRYRLIADLIALFLIGAFAGDVGAQSSGGPYSVVAAVVANGGGNVRGGAFRMGGTFGQVVTSASSTSRFQLSGGFWAPLSDVIFTSSFEQ